MCAVAIAAKQHALEVTSIDAGQMLARVAASVSQSVAVRGANTLPLRADAGQLEAALTQLLDGALRHKAAPVELRASLTPDGCVLLQVTGWSAGRVGMREMDRSGLALAQAIAAAHGGSAGVEATNGGSGTAWIAVPTFAGAAFASDAVHAAGLDERLV